VEERQKKGRGSKILAGEKDRKRKYLRRMKEGPRQNGRTLGGKGNFRLKKKMVEGVCTTPASRKTSFGWNLGVGNIDFCKSGEGLTK